jgi:Carboxypeptidase regulatory-like domain/TonB-dependent Receptor Plug Domain
MFRQLRTLLVSFLALTFCSIGYAQSAQIQGQVTDASGAIIPKAQVRVVDQRTETERETETNGRGEYTVPVLNPSLYKVFVSASGFSPAATNVITLSVAQVAVLDFKLQVGGASSQVIVNAEDAGINTTDASVSTVIDRQFVENLPLNGRSLQSLIALTPGVVISPSAETGDQGQLSVAGQRSGSNYYTLDGVSINFAASQTRWSGQQNGGIVAFSALGSTNSLVSVDALQEFRLVTSTYAPEFGRESGAQAVMATRSGGNSLHGTAFDYLRNDAFNSNDWFANDTGQAKPRERQNDFGGVLGGPILKNKAFWFFSYEGLRAVEPNFTIVDVPSVAIRASAAPSVKPLLDAFPLPNGPVTGVDLNQLAASVSNQARLDATSLRLDHSLNSRVTLFTRFDHSPSKLTQAGCNFTLSMSCQKHVVIDTGTFGASAILSPTATDNFRFNYSREGATSAFDLDDFGGAVVPKESDMFPSWETRETGFSGYGVSTGRDVNVFWGVYSKHINRQVNAVDTVEFTKATHTFKFGFDYRQLMPSGGGRDAVDFSWTYGGNPMPAFASGMPADYSSVDLAPDPPHLLFHNFSAFAQDSWKVSRRLTMTYGIRWDHNPPPTEASGNTYALSQVTDIATATLLPKGSPLWHPDWKNFAPRFGASYLLRPDPERTTVLRVGIGQFYDLGTSTASFLDNGYGYFPYSSALVLCNYGTGPNCNASYPYTGPQPPFVLIPPYPIMRAFDPDLSLPYGVEWSVGVEQAVSRADTFTVSYIGSVGRRLLRDVVYGDISPIINTVDLTTNGGYSNYNGLQLQYQRRMSAGLQALVSYSWSHSLDTNSSDVSQVGAAYVSLPPPYPIRQDYGNSDFDMRQSFSAGVTYNVPSPRVENFLVRSLLQDWSLDGLSSARTGTSFNAVYWPANPGPYTNGSGTPFFFRPELVPGQPIWISDSMVPGGKKLNSEAFTIPSELVQGSEGRNSIRGFPLLQIDLSVRRQFSIAERVKVQFRAEGFNIINHPNFGNPLNNMGTCVQGVPCNLTYGWGQSQAMLDQSLSAGGFYGSGFGSIYQIGGPRSLQLSMKVQF